VLDWEDSDEWYVPMQDGSTDVLEWEAKLERVKEGKRNLKTLVRYNLVQGRVARALPSTRALLPSFLRTEHMSRMQPRAEPTSFRAR
jgi:hypothetical protein